MSDSIENKYPYPEHFRRPKTKDEYSLDFIYSEDLNEIETGIKETLQGLDTANLAISIAVARIYREALYSQAGYDSYIGYLQDSEERLNIPKQTISDYKNIGDAYLKHKSRLQLFGFKEEGNLHKLRYLERAIEKHGAEEEVFKRLISDSFRNFKLFALEGVIPKEEPPYTPSISVTEDDIKIDGVSIINFSSDLRKENREELAAILHRVYEIKASGNEYAIFSVYDRKEAIALQNFLKRHRSRK